MISESEQKRQSQVTALGDMIFNSTYGFKHMILSHFPAAGHRLNLAETSMGEIIRWQWNLLTVKAMSISFQYHLAELHQYIFFFS